VQRQVTRLVGSLQRLLNDTLVGVYLHGSLATGGFNPARSDVDLLVVVRESLTTERRRRLAELLLTASGAPAPLEISVLTAGALHPWRHPAPHDFHFSESWRDRARAGLATGAPVHALTGGVDPDLAAHITHLRDRGIVLCGPPIADIFPEVPRRDYLDAILADVREALDALDGNPVYGVLNALRVTRFLEDGALTSKAEAGEWGLTAMPDALHPVIALALSRYRGDDEAGEFAPGALRTFRSEMLTRIDAGSAHCA
jgi:predicted nucleotidyltransferase